MKLKPGVCVTGIQPEMIIGKDVAQAVFAAMEYDFIITSITDGKHSKGSRHYSGQAIDIRTRHMSSVVAKEARDKIAKALPNDFDCVLEKTHIHLEFDPRYRG